MERRQRQGLSKQQMEAHRIVTELSDVLEEIFIDTGKQFLRAKSQARLDDIRRVAEALIRTKIGHWKKTKGDEAVRKALEVLALSEFDT